MSIHINEINQGKVLEVQVSGKLTSEDYKQFTPEFERLIRQHGKISVLFEMRDFHGWETGALWEDIKCDVKHFKDIEKLAMVGDKKWEQGMARFCRPFTTATIRYFDIADRESARAWIAGSPREASEQSPHATMPRT